jgi:glycosyltransferase involved in cell wall biosynthesis
MEKKPVFFKYIPAILLRAWHANKHGQYYKNFDIVEKFNQYKMFVCPEEIIGLPSISAFEGMACGCAFLGIDDPMYTGLGFVPGVNYIAYKKNNINDLVSKISYWQNNPKKLEVIAARGCEFVRDNFNRKRIADVLWKDLERITKDFSDQNKVNISCSFI